MTLHYTYDNKGRTVGVCIPISEWKKITKKYKSLDIAEDDLPPTKEEVLENIKEGMQQVKRHSQGKIKLKTAKQLLDEL